jgi:hypothetical protein
MHWAYGQLRSRLALHLLCLAMVGSMLVGCVSSTGPAGPPGSPGPAGPQGVQGPAGPPAVALGNQLWSSAIQASAQRPVAFLKAA